MSVTLLRVFMFTALPLLAAGVHIALDNTVDSRIRKLELAWLYLAGLSVAGSGLSGFFGHVFMSDVIAASIGWPAGSPFQLEMGFANLALGVLGILAMGRRDGFREATVIAVAVIGVGATIVHGLDILESGNLAPGNTVQNISNLLRPVFLIGVLHALRGAEQLPGAGTWLAGFEAWRGPRAQAAGFMTGLVATGFGAGFAAGFPVIGTGLGILAGAALTMFTIRR